MFRGGGVFLDTTGREYIAKRVVQSFCMKAPFGERILPRGWQNI